MICLFVFPGCGHLRDLHSFPTRRSSDLGPRGDERVARLRLGSGKRRSKNETGRSRSRCTFGIRPGQPAGARGPRSEEHTSELQSRRELVCRLLLATKKKKTITEHKMRRP